MQVIDWPDCHGGIRTAYHHSVKAGQGQIPSPLLTAHCLDLSVCLSICLSVMCKLESSSTCSLSNARAVHDLINRFTDIHTTCQGLLLSCVTVCLPEWPSIHALWFCYRSVGSLGLVSTVLLRSDTKLAAVVTPTVANMFHQQAWQPCLTSQSEKSPTD